MSRSENRQKAALEPGDEKEHDTGITVSRLPDDDEFFVVRSPKQEMALDRGEIRALAEDAGLTVTDPIGKTDL